MPIKITDSISTTAPSDTYATHSAEYGKGGFRSVNTLVQLNAITTERKEVGMWVKVAEDNKVYEWTGSAFIEVFSASSQSNNSTDISLPTNSVISGFKVIRVDSSGFAKYASNDDITHNDKVIGVSTQSITDNTPVLVRTEGFMDDAGWTFTPGDPIYVGLNGSITQTVPSSGFILNLGQALTATRILINIKTSIILT